MASNQYDSTSGSDPEERSLFTRAVENVEKAKKNLFLSTPTEAAASTPAEAATDRRTRPSTSASKKTKKRKSIGKGPIDQASTSSEDCIGSTPSKSPYTHVLTTLSSWSSAVSPLPMGK